MNWLQRPIIDWSTGGVPLAILLKTLSPLSRWKTQWTFHFLGFRWRGLPTSGPCGRLLHCHRSWIHGGSPARGVVGGGEGRQLLSRISCGNALRICRSRRGWGWCRRPMSSRFSRCVLWLGWGTWNAVRIGEWKRNDFWFYLV